MEDRNDNVIALKRASTFEDFWQNYPKKVGKPLAKAKFEAITNGGLHTRTLDRDSGQYIPIELSATPEELIEGAKRYWRLMLKERSQWEFKDDAKFLAHPATWLNQGRWMDYT